MMQKPIQIATAGGWPNLARRLKKFTAKTAFAAGTLLASSLFSNQIFAQTANLYSFEAISGTFTPLSASATAVPAILADGALSSSITFPNGFVFNFEGTNYTSFRVSSDGYLSFGTSTSNTASNDLATTTTSRRPLLAPLWDDLDGRATGGSKASYEVTGTAGSQVFTFEWLNWEFDYSSSTPVISFQIKLYEATGRIEYIYRSDAGAVVAGSASIGIAGAAAANYISLLNTSSNPVISTSPSYNSISTKPATGQIYAFAKPVALDISTTNLVSPGLTGCYGPNQTVTIQVKNTGTSAIDFSTNPLTISASATGANPATFSPVTINTGTLASGATQNVVVSTTYNMSAYGNYNFLATANLTGDGFPGNNSLPIQIRTISAPVALPQTVDFTGFTGANLTTLFPNWYEASGNTPAGTTSVWTLPASSQVTQLGSTTAKINLFTNSRKEWIVGPKITPTATTTLKFKAAVTDYESGAADPAGMTGTDDKVQVMVSTDCGLTFTPIFTINSSNNLTNNFTDFSVPLSTYAGQDIIVAFYATDGPIDDTPDYDFHLDDIFLGTPPSNDVGATALFAPNPTGCYTNAQPVSVTIKNFGSAVLDFAVNPVTVTVNVTGAVTQTLNATVNSGTLAIGATQNVVVGNLNMTTPGTYTFNGSTTLTGDGNAGNDAFTATTRTVTPVSTLPQSVDFTGFTGANLTTLFPNWYEATGTSPAGTSSAWTSPVTAQVTQLGSNTAKINLYTNTRAEWILGPKVTATATTALKFKAAVTDYNSGAAASVGMTGTDDKVQVMVSTNCGATFTPVLTFNSSSTLTNIFSDYLIPLGSYAGQEIIVGFYATDGPIDDAPDYDFHLDDIFLGTPPSNDVGATALFAPNPTGCYTNAQPVSVTIKNFGSAVLDFAVNPVTVTVNVTGAVTQTLNITVNTGTLAVGATQNVVVGNLNMTTPGTYTFNGSTTLTGDGNTSNNAFTATTRTVTPVSTLPQSVDFTGFTGANLTTLFPNWYEATGTTPTGTTSVWTSPASSQVTQLGSTTAKINLYTNTRKEWIVGPKVIPTATTALRFKVAVTDFNSGAADPVGMTGTDDMVQVMVSTDCGATFTSIKTFDATSNLTNIFSQQSVSLAAYAGQEIIVAFYATDGPIDDAPDYDFHLDDIVIRNIPAADAGTVKLITANSGCGLTNAENVCVVVRNEGSASQSNIPVSFRINNGIPVTETIAGPILPGDTLRYCFTGKANFLTAGNYNLKVYTTLSGDTETANDTISKVITSFNANFAVNNVDRCGPGAVTFTSNAPAGATVNWFTTATGGTPVSTGNTYSPTITGTTTYYAQLQTSASAKVGKASTTGADGKNTGGGLKFNAALPFMLDSVVVYTDLAAGGNLIINLKNATGTVINTTTYALPAVTGMTAVTIPLKWNIPAGSNYTLEQGSSLNLFRDTSAGFPYVSLAQAVTITDGTVAGYYYFFYNWSITVGCTNPIIPVTATVNAIPATPTISAAGATTFCTGGSVALTAASTTTGATYAWYLNGTAISGATSATYTANAAGNYTVIASAGGCPSAASAATAVTVNATPATPTITQNGGTLTSSATTGNQWYLNGTLIPGATGQTLITTANGSYTVIATANGCPSATSAAQNVTNTGLGDAMAGMSVQVYPNPATGSFNVKLNGYQKDATVVLYSLTGQQLIAETATADGNARNISLKGLAAGTYLLKVSSDKGVQVTRLIVQ